MINEGARSRRRERIVLICAIVLVVGFSFSGAWSSRGGADAAQSAATSSQNVADILDRRVATAQALSAESAQQNCSAHVQARKGSIQLRFDALVGRIISEGIQRTDPAYPQIQKEFQDLALEEAEVQKDFDNIDALCFAPYQPAIDAAKKDAEEQHRQHDNQGG